MKVNVERLVAAIGRVAGGAVKNPSVAITKVATIALAIEQVLDGVTALRAAVASKDR